MRSKKVKNHVFKNVPISNKQTVCVCIALLVISSGLFLAAIFCEPIAQSIWMRAFKMGASLYMALLGGLASMVTLRLTPADTETEIKRLERMWGILFFVVTACLAFVGGWLSDIWWEIIQFYGYAIAAYFVGCLVGTDPRKPDKQSNQD